MEEKWKHVVVLGAAGKMGKGIALLLLQEIALMPGSVLTLLDANSRGFEGLKKYLREHLLKYAERNINRLRKYYQERVDLIDNGDMINAFLEEGLDRTSFAVGIEECRGATMIFEAILEDVDIKASVFLQINKIADSAAVYFTNTSSIPIHILQEKAHLAGRLIGFHFYNPPAVQKLLEIIIPKGVKEDVFELALEVGKRLNKIIVISEDTAGFIGNGHFIREVNEACDKVEELQEKMSLPEAVCLVNSITENYLIRPMGLFQLIDYVGIDVVQHIAKVMTHYLKNENFNHSLIDVMVQAGVKGGQNGAGMQEAGFFSYEQGKPVKVYDIKNSQYVPLFEKNHAFPQEHQMWKALSKDLDKDPKIIAYFVNLLNDQSFDSKIAVEFLEKSRSIAHGLVKDKVAGTIQDVDMVLKNGFFHLYDVDMPWVEQEVVK